MGNSFEAPTPHTQERERVEGPRYKSFMVGARKAFMWMTAAGFISGCGPIVVNQTIDGKPLDQVMQENKLKEKIKRPDASMKEDVKSIRKQFLDSIGAIRDQGKQIGYIEARSKDVVQDGKTKVLLNIQATLETGYLKKNSSHANLYVVVYDPDNQTSSQDGFAVVNTYSLAKLGSQPIGTQGKIEVNHLIESKSGIRVLLTGSPSFQDSLRQLIDSNKAPQIDTLVDVERGSSSRGLHVKDSQAFSGFLDSSDIKNDATTVSFDYSRDRIVNGKTGGLVLRENTRFDEDSIGGLSVEKK